MSTFRLCESPMEDGRLYFIGYGDLVSGYRHAYRRVIPGSRIGRTEIKLTRSSNHPADPKCPGCHDSGGVA